MISFKSLKLGLKICITILVFYFFLLEVLSISNFEVIEKELKSVNQRFLTLFLILSLTNALLFAVRTQLILNHYNYYPSLLSVYFVTMTRNFFSDLLPAKLGTLVYIYLLPRFLGTNYKLATSAFFHLTFLDIFAVGVLVLVLGGFASLTSKLNLTIYVYLAAVALLLTSILLIRVLPKFLKFALDKYSFRAHPNLQETLNLFENLNSSGIFTKLIGLALAQRFVKYFSYWILFLALVDIYGISSDSNPFFKAAFAFITAETFVSMPIFTIGG
ncbi:MAG: flippase-like domain-containing protein, partial [Deltaproteobacteria bacterium]|nr:flippase-like domain-containing protein [Deltaproteobacteria bacterium]